MRRPPYSHRIIRGIFLIYKKMTINIENGYLPSWWTKQDIKDVKRALGWLGDFFDWVEWRAEEKRKQAELDKEAKRLAEEGPEVCANV